jgi:hypothetical protein
LHLSANAAAAQRDLGWSAIKICAFHLMALRLHASALSALREFAGCITSQAQRMAAMTDVTPLRCRLGDS